MDHSADNFSDVESKTIKNDKITIMRLFLKQLDPYPERAKGLIDLVSLD